MNLAFNKVTEVARDGAHAHVQFLSEDGQEHVLVVPLETLWVLGTELRQASIRLVAPISAYTDAEPGAVLEGEGPPDPSPEIPEAEPEDQQVKDGFGAVEQSWELCDVLNAGQKPEDSDPLRIFNERIRHHWLVDATADNVQTLRDESYFTLRNGFVVRFRAEQGDWIPDRPERDGDGSDETE